MSATASLTGLPRGAWLMRWGAGQRKTTYLCALVLGACAFVLTIYGLRIWAEHEGAAPGHPPELGDFLALWSYGRIAAAHPAADLYDAVRLHALQVGLGMPGGSHDPFPYPPVAIPLFRLLAVLPCEAAYVAWTLGTLALFVWVVAGTCSRRAACVLGAVVAPAGIGCIAAGQTGFLAAALLVAGVRLAGSRPMLGGVLIGLLAFKPQAALLVPLAFAAAGWWRAAAAACVTVAVLAGLATLAYGAASWTDWLAMLPAYSAAFDRDRAGLVLKPTIMANLQLLGVALAPARAVQGLAGVAVAGLVWRRFRRDAGRLATATLLVGTVLASPHAFVYDLPVIVAAMALLIEHRMAAGAVFGLGEVVVLVLGFTFPLLMMARVGQVVPPVSAVALLLLFGLILREAGRSARGALRGGES